MKNIIVILLCFAIQSVIATEIKIFDVTLSYDAPDENMWNLPSEKFDVSRNVGSIIYTRDSIIDDDGNPIAPVIAIIYEKLDSDSIDAILYSLNVRMRPGLSFKIDSIHAATDFNMKYLNGVVYDAYYIKGGYKHEVFVVHMVKDTIGIQIICDSTESIYSKVMNDMLKFIRSVDFK